MFNEIIEWLEGVTATIISGVALVVSLVLNLVGVGVPIYLDPAWVAVMFSGVPILYSAVKKLIVNKGIAKISSSLLIAAAMIASVAIGDLFAAGEIAFIMAIGEILEDKTTAKAKKGLKKLINLVPATGRRIVNDEEQDVAAEKIAVGDILRILPGETIPVDGVIISGETSVDQSIMTGESLPIDKSVGDNLFCGTVNCFGSVDIKATKVGNNSSLQKLIKMVKDAENKKAPIQRTADKWANLLVPVALLLAVVAGLLKQDIVVAVTMLVVFCPCALVLATPTAVMAAIGQATKHGVIIKSGEALERMGKADTVAFDKTGTLTNGELEVSNIISFSDSMAKGKILLLAASVESKSEHPLGKAIVNFAKSQGVNLLSAENFKMEAGKGVFSEIDGQKLCCGNEKYLRDNAIDISNECIKAADELRKQGKALVFVADERKVLGLIALADTVRPDAPEMIKSLKNTNTDIVLLTGDNNKAADYFADQLGINQVRAELLPEEKVYNITDLQSRGKRVCMIGDGVNDAPALKTADVGVAMGTMGSDIAVEAADIALVGDDISKIPYLKRLSNATLNTIKLSISLSLIINFLAIVLSFFGLLNPTTGALVHNAGSVFVILIAALLYERKF